MLLSMLRSLLSRRHEQRFGAKLNDLFPETNGFNILLPTRLGWMVVNKHDKYIGRSFQVYGEFSEIEAELLCGAVREGGAVVEVGANVGAHTIALASAVGPAGTVIAFEPQRLVFQMLCANLALNSIPNVYPYHAAVGRSPGTITVPELSPDMPNNFGGVSMDVTGAGQAVPLVTIDDLGLSACDLIKVDVEGMEEEVLAGASGTITKFRPVLYVENDRLEKSASLIRFVRDLGYRMWWHLPPLYNPSNFLGNKENIFPGVVSCNMLCVPKETNHNPPLQEVLNETDWVL